MGRNPCNLPNITVKKRRSRTVPNVRLKWAGLDSTFLMLHPAPLARLAGVNRAGRLHQMMYLTAHDG